MPYFKTSDVICKQDKSNSPKNIDKKICRIEIRKNSQK